MKRAGFWLLIVSLLGWQQWVLRKERCRLALLIAVVEHDQQVHGDIPGPELLDACPLPQYIGPPKWDLGKEKEREQ